MIHGYFNDLYQWPELVELTSTYAILFSPQRTLDLSHRKDASELPETDTEASDKRKCFNLGATHNEYDISDSYRVLPTPPKYRFSKEKTAEGKNTMNNFPACLQAIQMHYEAAMTTTLDEMKTFGIYVHSGHRIREIHLQIKKSRPR